MTCTVHNNGAPSSRQIGPGISDSPCRSAGLNGGGHRGVHGESGRCGTSDGARSRRGPESRPVPGS